MKYKKTTLPSGLRVITVPAKDNPSVTVLVMVETGSNYEEKEINGLSHFLEHMCFKGTGRRPSALHISQELDSLGAENNAFTTHEMTGYYAKANKKHLEKILDVISDMYLYPAFPKEDLEKERGVIMQEISAYEDKPERKVWEALFSLMYGDTPAGRPVIGMPENIKKFSREDFVNYRDTHYVAEKTLVIVAGDVTHGKSVELIKKYFKNIQKGKRVGKPKVVEKQKSPQLKIVKKKTDQTHVVVGFRSYDAHSEKVPAVNLLAAILGMGMSSRLFQKLREEMGACYYVRANHEEATDHGFFAIATGINIKRLEEVTKVLVEECEKLKIELVTSEELDKAKEYYIGHLYMALETTDMLAEFCGSQEIVSGKVKTAEQIEKEIRAVKTEEIQKLAREIFRNDNLNMAIVGNVTSEKSVKKVLSFK